eukprot:629594-Alexandrium_andersonii.AAC.1
MWLTSLMALKGAVGGGAAVHGSAHATAGGCGATRGTVAPPSMATAAARSLSEERAGKEGRWRARCRPSGFVVGVQPSAPLGATCAPGACVCVCMRVCLAP